MADIVIDKRVPKSIDIRKSMAKTVEIEKSSRGGGGSLKLTPTAELVDNGVMLHYVTMDQMEKMHIRVEGTDTGTLGFVLTKDEDYFELRFSADSPQAFAGGLVYDDSLDIVDYVFGDLLVEIPTGYDVQWVSIDGVDANLLEADINWRLADIQQKATGVASFFNITEATEYTALTPAEAIAIARDCQYNVMGTDWPIPTWLPTGVTEAQVESAAEGLGIPYHEPTQTA